MGNCLSSCKKKKYLEESNKNGETVNKDTDSDLELKRDPSAEMMKDKSTDEELPPINTTTTACNSTPECKPKVKPKGEDDTKKENKSKRKKRDQSSESETNSDTDTKAKSKTKSYGNVQITNVTNARNAAIGHGAQFIDNRKYITVNKEKKETKKKKETEKTDKDTGQDEFLKAKDDTGLVHHIDQLSRASQSVGLICYDSLCGTGFRVGTRYIMTAYHIIRRIIDPQRTGNFRVDKLARSDVYIVFDCKNEKKLHKGETVYHRFKPEIKYKNEELDTVILELEDSGKEFPIQIASFDEIDENKTMYLLGHPDGDVMKYDPKIEIWHPDKEVMKSAKSWSEKKFGENGYEGMDDERKVLFHTSFQHGASGAPAVMLTNKEEVTVVLMLVKGYPKQFYDLNKEKKKEFLEEYREFLIEQGIAMKSVWRSMKDIPEYQRLLEDIFPTDCFNA